MCIAESFFSLYSLQIKSDWKQNKCISLWGGCQIRRRRGAHWNDSTWKVERRLIKSAKRKSIAPEILWVEKGAPELWRCSAINFTAHTPTHAGCGGCWQIAASDLIGTGWIFIKSSQLKSSVAATELPPPRSLAHRQERSAKFFHEDLSLIYLLMWVCKREEARRAPL